MSQKKPLVLFKKSEGDSGVTLLEGVRGQGLGGCPID